MTLCCFIYSLLFLMFSVEKVRLMEDGVVMNRKIEEMIEINIFQWATWNRNGNKQQKWRKQC